MEYEVFLKPDLSKILIFIILVILVFIFIFNTSCDKRALSPLCLTYKTYNYSQNGKEMISSVAVKGMKQQTNLTLFGSYAIEALIIFAYLLSCYVVVNQKKQKDN